MLWWTLIFHTNYTVDILFASKLYDPINWVKHEAGYLIPWSVEAVSGGRISQRICHHCISNEFTKSYYNKIWEKQRVIKITIWINYMSIYSRCIFRLLSGPHRYTLLKSFEQIMVLCVLETEKIIINWQPQVCLGPEIIGCLIIPENLDFWKFIKKIQNFNNKNNKL